VLHFKRIHTDLANLWEHRERKIKHMSKLGKKAAAGTVAVLLLQGAIWGTAASASTGLAQEKQAVYADAGWLRTYIGAASATDSRYGDYTSGAIPNAIAKTSPSVVAIIGKQASRNEETAAGRFDLVHGTGVVVGSSGTIMTNAHVVKDMDHIVVVTYDGKQYNGKITHMDEESDLALVSISATGLKEAVFAAKADIQVGETVIAIGTPISFSLRNSVTVGVVSGLDRSVNSTYRLLQTDAAINPGNSGGALVNLKGEVVGINTLKYADYGVDNLGFAIPSDTAQYVLKHFLAYGKVKRSYVGMELEESWAALVGIPTEEPMTVGVVEAGSPADKAGIKSGDKLLKAGEDRVKNLVEYNEFLKRYLPGESAEFTLQATDGSTVKRTVVFGEEAGSGSSVSNGGNSGGAFDSDEGKTRIGDSRYGWSMKYPAGLDIYHQSADGDSVSLSDAKGEYSLTVTTSEKTQDYTPSALLKFLASKEDDTTILERQYVNSGSQSYARIVSKDSYGYYESRAYVSGEYVSHVSMNIYEEKDYKNSIKRKGYAELMDSFGFNYDKEDASVKNVAVNQDGYRRHNHADYGYTISVPATWETSAYSSYDSTYYDEDYEISAGVRIVSLAEGDSLDKWVKRTAAQFEREYAPDYIEFGEIQDTRIDGVPAKSWKVSMNTGEEWEVANMFFLVEDGYKYLLTIAYPEDTEEAEELVSRISGSLELNLSGRNSALGFIQDELDLIDYSKKVKITSKLGYSMEVPEYWHLTDLSDYGSSSSEDERTFRFTGGMFEIAASKEETFEDAVKSAEKLHKRYSDNVDTYKVTSTDETVFGVPAKKYVVTDSSEKFSSEMIQVVFHKEGVTYNVSWELADSSRTEVKASELRNAFESLRFK
jgi:serine protease Do